MDPKRFQVEFSIDSKSRIEELLLTLSRERDDRRKVEEEVRRTVTKYKNDFDKRLNEKQAFVDEQREMIVDLQREVESLKERKKDLTLQLQEQKGEVNLHKTRIKKLEDLNQKLYEETRCLHVQLKASNATDRRLLQEVEVFHKRIENLVKKKNESVSVKLIT